MNRAQRRAAAKQIVKRDVSGAAIREVRRRVARDLLAVSTADQPDPEPTAQDLGLEVRRSEGAAVASLKDTVITRIQDIYDAHGTAYRLYWSLIQAGAAGIATYATGKPGVFPLVYAAAVIVTSEARKAKASPAA